MKFNFDEFSYQIAATRIERGQGLKDIAKETGVSLSTISRAQHEKMKTIDINNILALCKWMGQDINTFIIKNA